MTTQKELAVGERVPKFLVWDLEGNEIDSEDLTADYSLIVFLRYAGCPFCNLAMYRLIREYSILQKNGCEVMTVIESSKENITKYISDRQDKKIPFSIISDENHELYDQFGIRSSIAQTLQHSIRNFPAWLEGVTKKGFTNGKVDGDVFVIPAFFLIDRRGEIKLANYHADVYEDDTFTPIYEQLTLGDAVGSFR